MKELKKILLGALALVATSSATLGVTSIASASGTDSFEMESGASVRMTDPVGIRFISKISQDEYTALTNPELGTLMIPQSVLGDNDLTLETENVLKVPMTNWLENDEDSTIWTYTGVLAGEYDETTSSYAGLPSEYWNTPITAVGYVTSDEGTAYTSSLTRSVAQVASSAILETDESKKPTGIYYDFLLNIVDTVLGDDGFEFAQDTVTMNNGTTCDLNALFSESNGSEGLTVAWSAEGGVSVENGVVTANSMGTATVTATIGSYTDSVTITVLPTNYLSETKTDGEYYLADFSSSDYSGYVAKAGTSTGTVITFESGYVNYYSVAAWNSQMKYTFPTTVNLTDVAGFTFNYNSSSSSAAIYAMFYTSASSTTTDINVQNCVMGTDGEYSIAYIAIPDEIKGGELKAIGFKTNTATINVLVRNICFVTNEYVANLATDRFNTCVNETTGEYLLADGDYASMQRLSAYNASYSPKWSMESDGSLKITQNSSKAWQAGGVKYLFSSDGYIALDGIDKIVFRVRSTNNVYLYLRSENAKTIYCTTSHATVTTETGADGTEWKVWTIDVATQLARTDTNNKFTTSCTKLAGFDICSNTASAVIYVDSITYVKK